MNIHTGAIKETSFPLYLTSAASVLLMLFLATDEKRPCWKSGGSGCRSFPHFLVLLSAVHGPSLALLLGKTENSVVAARLWIIALSEINPIQLKKYTTACAKLYQETLPFTVEMPCGQ